MNELWHAILDQYNKLLDWYWIDKPQKPIRKSFRFPQEIADIVESESKRLKCSETDYMNQAILFYSSMLQNCIKQVLEKDMNQKIKCESIELGDGTKKLKK